MTRIPSSTPSPKAVAVYQFICDFKAANDGNSPTSREIAAACDIPSTSVVHYYLNMLCDFGMIRFRGVHVSRRIELIGGAYTCPQPVEGQR